VNLHASLLSGLRPAHEADAGDVGLATLLMGSHVFALQRGSPDRKVQDPSAAHFIDVEPLSAYPDAHDIARQTASRCAQAAAHE